MQLACRIFRFYGDTDLADLINQTLQLVLPEEDHISQLLHNCHLEDLDSFVGHRTSRKHALYDSMRHLQIKQDQFYWQHSDADTVPPPHVSTGLLQLTILILSLLYSLTISILIQTSIKKIFGKSPAPCVPFFLLSSSPR